LILREVGCGSFNWIHLVQERHQWRALVSTVMNVESHKMVGNSWVADQASACHKGHASLELISQPVGRSEYVRCL
jgi:5-methylthioribose kinase